MHAPRKEKWQEKFKRSRYLFGAILFHLILFLMLATLVIWPAPPLPPTAEFRPVTVKPPPPPVQPPSAGASASNPDMEPNPVVVPVVAPPSVIATQNNNVFRVDVPKIQELALTDFSNKMAHGAALGQGGGGSGNGTGSGFGSSTGTSNQLQGNLYDLKQTPDGKSTDMDPGKFHQIISQFVMANWDPTMLNQYYRASKALYTSFIFIPTLNAEDAPQAFGVENEVQPNMYVIWYKITAVPPQDGTYHFVGCGDDILAARVNGKTVLDGCLTEIDHDVRQSEKKYEIVNYEETELNDPGTPDGEALWVSRSFHALAGQPVDIDVLIGEEPGGKSNYFLLIQREESSYKTQSNGTPLLPIFQLDSNPVEPKGDSSSYPPYSPNIEVWGPAPSQ